MGIASAEEVQLAIAHDENKDYQITTQTIDDVVGDSIPEKHLSEKAKNDIFTATSVADLKSIYNAYVFSEPIAELKSACATRKKEIEEGMIYDN